MNLTLQPIGFLHSCFKEKFGIPRQPRLIKSALARLDLLPPFNRAEAVRGLDGFSHVWLIFGFHATAAQGWRPTVRPPRLGGNKRMGVFATRSTFRPNPVGLSVVTLDRIEIDGSRVSLHFAGIDLLDGTPIYDIKPYLPFVDKVNEASGGFAETEPKAGGQVNFSTQAEQVLQREFGRLPKLRELITQMLQHDPRPAYLGAEPNQGFGVKVYDFNVKWSVEADQINVSVIEKAD